MVYPIGKRIIPPIYKLWLRKVEGLENVPKNIPFIIAANHASYYDAMLLHTILIPELDKKIHALANSGYWNNWFTRMTLNWGECIPVYVKKERDADLKNKQATEKALKYLRNGELVQIFPEGTRSFDGKLKKAYPGVAKLALKAKVPVLPVGITDSYKVFPKGRLFPRLIRCEVKIGKLMHFNEKPNEKAFQSVTKKIMKQIAKLIGQEYNY